MRILTGIQPTNILHLGNYFGALKPAIELQREDDLFMMIVDLHAITVPQEPAQLKQNIAFATAAYLAAGIDPKRATLFQQSRVPAHAELGWLLQTVARMGELERMTQFKDKAKAKGQNVSVGLFTYPVLMAADILLYDTQAVPVGEDQKQHLELARDLAERFNRDFGETFVIPNPIINIASGRILALDNPSIKMSKSAASAKNYISLMDSADEISKKIKSAVTDSEAGISVDEGRPGLRNLLSIFSLVTDSSMEELASNYASKGMKALKEDLASALVAHLEPLQAKINDYLSEPEELEKIVAAGSQHAAKVANLKIAEVKRKMGLSL
ncbi:MAG: tryptophan--tRNA ligase [Patescibacteria group bacterium]